jgi:hypothetical protein
LLIRSGFLIDVAVMVVQSYKVIRKKLHKEHMLELAVASTRLEESSKVCGTGGYFPVVPRVLTVNT